MEDERALRELIGRSDLLTNATPVGMAPKEDASPVDLSLFTDLYAVVDAIAKKDPEKLAMIHIAKDMTERRFTFRDMKR